MFRLHKLSIALIIASFALTLGQAKPDKKTSSEWSQFRGPNGTGVAETTGLPTEFGPKTNVVWKTELPPGHSSPVLTRDRIFVTAFSKVATTARRFNAHGQASPIDKENYKLLVIAIDRATGKIIWEREAPRANRGRLQNVNNPA